MTPTTLAFLVLALALTGLFLCVPVVDLLLPPCVRYIRSRRQAVAHQRREAAHAGMRAI